MKKSILSPKHLLAEIKRLPVEASIADRFERDLLRHETAAISSGSTAWYRHQKEHWLGWLSQYHLPGYYGRKASTKRTAKFAFNGIKNSAMILWLVDASGVARSVVKSARLAAEKASGNMNSQCAAIRAIAPWETVEEALSTRRPSRKKAGG